MSVHFFQYNPDARVETAAPLPPDMHIRCWRPDFDGFPPRGSRLLSNQFWWALARAGGFARKGFAEIRIDRGNGVVHRLIVTPRWYRFPFMAPEDLQIGRLWTSPDARRTGLARAAMGEAHRRFANDSARIWYVADAANAASQALALSCGYRLVATGRRTRRFGTPLLGQYVIDRFV